MQKLTVVVLAVAFAGTASAAGWRDLRIDASSEAAFTASVATLQKTLPPVRRFAFEHSLRDLWAQGVQRATTEQSEYTSADYFRQLDGLAYEEVVKLADPTGETRKQRYRAASLTRVGAAGRFGGVPGSYPPAVDGGAYRGASRSVDRQTH